MSQLIIMERIKKNYNIMKTFDGHDIVDQVTPEVMEGDSPLEKELNAYLTKRFIVSSHIPADECLQEAKHIVALVLKHGLDIHKK